MPSNTCAACGRHFTANSSLKRHSKLYCLNRLPPSRKRSCRECAAAKLRCDLGTPKCGRCASRKSKCTYESWQREIIQTRHETRSSITGYSTEPKDTDDGRQQQQSRVSSPTSCVPLGIPRNPEERARFPELVISPERRRILLNHNGTPGTLNLATTRTMHLVVRLLKSWTRIMASSRSGSGPSAAHLPPIIHPLQLQKDNIPQPLAHCCTLARMWANQAEGSAALVYQTIRAEVQNQLQQLNGMSLADTPALLAASQAVLILLIILLFGFNTPTTSVRSETQIILDAWAAKDRLTESGLMLDEFATDSTTLGVLSWQAWALTAAKRRTVLALHHVEWAWSLMRGYPVLSCFELGPLPAPDAGYLWRATDKDAWTSLYNDWLRKWASCGGRYRMAEIFSLDPIGPLSARTEMWLAEADEFGILLMAEVNAISE
ncbi:uncharacterized protein V2V93DRAFT_360832 [Kockiozyma suomiensis]|uniref:uncharacterized protein n=1 Tax=Kockiozyma suomiensis TaxID=1337062 RepID=UPI0033440160